MFRKTEELREGRSVYTLMHDSKYSKGRTSKLFSDQGVWSIDEDYYGNVLLRAATPSESPTSVTWQYKEHPTIDKCHEDPALTVTSLSEKPSDCEVTISLSQDVKSDISEPGVEGLYKADGSYYKGRPVLKHQGQGGLLTLYMDGGGWWSVSPGVGYGVYLCSGSAPSQCPADPRAARNDMRGRTHWEYTNKQYRNNRWSTESSGVTIRCAKHSH